MTYIHSYDENYGKTYRPRDEFRNILELQIIQPFRETKPEVANLYVQRDYSTIGVLLKDILARGSTDFDIQSTNEHFGVFTPKDKVLFYCANYMCMHLYSCYHIYTSYLMQHNALLDSKHIIFIDYGCGPLTSGIAFWNAARQHKITYIGLDISQNMLDKASEINRHSPLGNSRPYFNDIYLKQNYELIPNLLKVIEMGNTTDTVIIFNLCYVLAPITFKGDIRRFIKVLHDAVQVSSEYKTCFLYQNPTNLTNAHTHWHTLRDEVMHNRYLTPQEFVGQSDNVGYKYELLMERSLSQPIYVTYEMLYNW